MLQGFNKKCCNVPHFDEEHFSLWLTELVGLHQKEIGDLQYYFISDSELLQMNRDVLDHDYYTDIITFDACQGDLVNGEAYISIDRVIDNAETNKVSPVVELSRVIAHGLLHLLGYNDKTQNESREMRTKEDWALSLLS
jgi:rRNA maturation RNase YbeY